MATHVSSHDALASVLQPATENVGAPHELMLQASPLGVRRPPAIATADLQDVKGYMAHHKGRRYSIAMIAILVVGIACAAVNLTIAKDSTVPATHDTPVDGLTIFGVFFVAAMAIERLLEPLSKRHASKGRQEALGRRREN
jgi:hypothetical protein